MASNGCSTARRCRPWPRSGRSARTASRGRSRCFRSPPSCGRGEPRAFHTDPIVLDTFTHLLGLLGAGLPRAGRRDLPAPHGPPVDPRRPPPEGTRVALPDPRPRGRAAPGPRRCRARPPRRPRLDADRRLGRLAVPLAVALSRRVPGPRHDLRRRGAAAPRHRRHRGVRRLARSAGRHGPAGLAGRPGADQLGPEEQVGLPRASADPEVRRTHRLWGRIAAKEAARRIWLAAGRSRPLPGRPGRRQRSGRPTMAPRPGPAGRSRSARGLDRPRRGRRRRAGGSRRRFPRPESTSSRSRVARARRGARSSRGEQALAGAMAGRHRGRNGSPGSSRPGRRPPRRRARTRRPIRPIRPRSDRPRLEPATRGRRRSRLAPPAVSPGEYPGSITARRGEHVWAWTLGERVELMMHARLRVRDPRRSADASSATSLGDRPGDPDRPGDAVLRRPRAWRRSTPSSWARPPAHFGRPLPFGDLMAELGRGTDRDLAIGELVDVPPGPPWRHPDGRAVSSDRGADAMPRDHGERPELPRPASGRRPRRGPDPRPDGRPVDLVPLAGDGSRSAETHPRDRLRPARARLQRRPADGIHVGRPCGRPDRAARRAGDRPGAAGRAQLRRRDRGARGGARAGAGRGGGALRPVLPGARGTWRT